MRVLKELSDQQIINRIKELNDVERKTVVELLIHIGELDWRKAYRELGYSSTFDYLVRGLKCSEASAWRRQQAARFLHRFPEAIELLKAREISVTTISKFAEIVTDENYSEVMEGVRGRSVSEVNAFVSTFRPQRKVKEYVKPVTVQIKPRLQLAKGTERLPLFEAPSARIDASEPEEIQQCFDIKFLANEDFMKNLKEVEQLLSGKFPAGLRPKQVFAELMEFFLNHKCPKRKQARVEGRKGTVKQAPSQGTSAQDRRRVLLNSGQQCEYVSDDGIRCSCTWDLEIDHIQPRAMNGDDAPENLRVLCRAHNLMFAERYFGSRKG